MIGLFILDVCVLLGLPWLWWLACVGADEKCHTVDGTAGAQIVLSAISIAIACVIGHHTFVLAVQYAALRAGAP